VPTLVGAEISYRLNLKVIIRARGKILMKIQSMIKMKMTAVVSILFSRILVYPTD
jgi:hypothetical protein